MTQNYYRSFALSLVAVFSQFCFPSVVNASNSPSHCGGTYPYLTCTKAPATNFIYNFQPFVGNQTATFSNYLTGNDFFRAMERLNNGQKLYVTKDSPTSGPGRFAVVFNNRDLYWYRDYAIFSGPYYNAQTSETYYTQSYVAIRPPQVDNTFVLTRQQAMPRESDYFGLYYMTAQFPMMAVFVGELEDALRQHFPNLTDTRKDFYPKLHNAVGDSATCLTDELTKLLEDWNEYPNVADQGEGQVYTWSAEAATCATQNFEPAVQDEAESKGVEATLADISTLKPIPSVTGTTNPMFVTTRLESEILNAFVRTTPPYPINNSQFQHLEDRLAIFYQSLFIDMKKDFDLYLKYTY